MNKKNIIKISIGVAVAVIVCIAAIFIIKIKKDNKIRLGMSREDVILILDKGRYEYTKFEDTDGIKVNEVTIKNIQGELGIGIDDNIVNYIAFVPNIDGMDENEIEKILYDYLIELYGSPSYEMQEGKYKYWNTERMTIIFSPFPMITWDGKS